MHQLIVTGPLRDCLFERFSRLYSSATDVRVVKDRRYGERRRTPQAASDDRRRADRRQRSSEWVFPPEAS